MFLGYRVMSSTASDADSDAGPVNPNIDITAQPAVLTWRTPDGENLCLSNLHLDVHYDARSSKAFFKLRVAVALKLYPRSRNTAIFLFIHPERIRALDLEDSPCGPEAAVLGPEIVCLHFELSRLSALVVPKKSLAPRNQTSGNLLDSMRAVVQQATFSVYTKIPCRLLPQQRLLALLCGAASRNQLKSITAHSTASSLSAGAGGKIIEGDGLCPDNTVPSEGRESAIEPPIEDPPSYEEGLGAPPPEKRFLASPPFTDSPAAVPSLRKRQRLSTPASESVAHSRVDRKYIEDICAHMVDSKLSQFRGDMSKQLQDLENSIIDYVDEQLILQRQEITEDIGLQTEDKHYGLKLGLQNYVREEVEEAEG
ncbi:hypothetical protein RRF57_011907 [Xylaria bambusicola]|uniref:Uncharacterized protein n=1 Tax=Xylaria bambusicola TaxID=326684 RepID=A0AAN7UNM0_9PEZI